MVMSYPRDHIIIRKSTHDVISSFGQERGTALLPLAYHNSGIFIKSTSPNLTFLKILT